MMYWPFLKKNMIEKNMNMKKKGSQVAQVTPPQCLVKEMEEKHRC